MSFEIISVIGLGYIGLPTAAMFASKKKKVVGIDVNEQTIDMINKGQVHIVEPDLDAMVSSAVHNGYLEATNSLQPADAFIISVPTPFLSCEDDETPSPDLSYVEAASRGIAMVLKKGDLVVLESTSPIGATEQMAEWLAEERPNLTFPQQAGEDADINIAHCPERVLPGHVVRELVENDRIIGGLTKICSFRAKELYGIFVEGECVETNARTAEMAKLTENASRDVSIAFANELSLICDEKNIDVWELISLANRHPRVNILQPGPGVGGHCIAVDPWFIVSASPKHSRLIRAAREVNNQKPIWVVEKIRHLYEKIQNDFPKRTDIAITLLGLSYKPNIDDVRESPAMRISEEVSRIFPNRITIVEPNIERLPPSLEGYAKKGELLSSIGKSDIIVLLVDHREFKLIDSKIFKGKQLLDTRGLYR